jgi:trimeric autotransporter adhesin
MKNIILLIFYAICFFCLKINAQQNVGIGTGTPHSSSLLDIRSNNKGMLVPRVNLISETDVVTIAAPAISLLVYNTNNTLTDGEGFYFWNGTKWSKLMNRANVSNLAWGVTGNSGTNTTTDFIGTIDNKPLVFKTNNILSGKIDPGDASVFFGQSAGAAITTGANNSFFGHLSGTANTTGANNLFAGHNAGALNLTANGNVFLGQDAGQSNTIGNRNTYVGEDAGINKTDGNANTFIGNGAGSSNFGILSKNNMVAVGTEAFGGTAIPRDYSIAIGDHAGYNAVSATGPGIFIGSAAGYNGGFSIAIGDSASYSGNNFNGIAIGTNSLKNISGGGHNVGLGTQTLENTGSGVYNVSIGSYSLNDNTTGSFNVAIGNNSLDNNITGNNNLALGSQADFFGTNTGLNNTTIIGANAKVSTGNTMVFGDAAVTKWAFGLNTTGALNALQVGSSAVNGNGAFLTLGGTWTNTSDINKKEDFSDLNSNELLQKIAQLSIQRWKYKGTNEYHIGPTAQDFYKLFGLGTDDKSISTVDPAGIALAAIQEQQRLIEKQNELLLQLQKRIEVLEKK